MEKESSKGKSIKEITDIIVKFSESRDWANEDPSDLVTSAFIELGELAEHYQWEHEFRKLNDVEKKEIGYEFVDVIFYLFRLAGRSGIDIEKSFDEKLVKLAKKFPPKIGDGAKQRHDEYRKTGKNKLYE